MTKLIHQMFVACLTILLAVLALQWAAQILQEIWPVLAVAAGVVLVAAGLGTFIWWRFNRW